MNNNDDFLLSGDGGGHSTSDQSSADYPFRKVAPELYTLDTLAISVSAGAVAALLVGFISGNKSNTLPCCAPYF